ncbi:alpha/beta hydrolase [Halobacteria archaeon AArc-curdl1]|uniref:Alpha/beta hydrolase n=1 Tax=Natronosalvus hydrolyticus TaxID=2979988 RepID=A0AAP2ZBE1_9EURY|nr:alpha/beta hydrolase [Halobacteria archaeon AArc-curdl1]
MKSRVGGTGRVTVDGCRLAYRRAGTDGPPIVLLHGGGIDDSQLSWHETIPRLARTHQVYAIDWPGYGDSRGHIDHTVPAYVDLLEAVLDALDLEEVTLVGLSMGGAIALGYALEQPNRVARLALVGSYGLGPRVPVGSVWKTLAMIPGVNDLGWAAVGSTRESALMGLSSVVATPSSLSDEFLEAFRTRATQAGSGQAFEAFQRNEISIKGAARTDFTAELSTLEVPTLLVHGEKDPLFPVVWSRRAATTIPDATLEVFDNCGHWVPIEHPVRFNDRLGTFLESAR